MNLYQNLYEILDYKKNIRLGMLLTPFQRWLIWPSKLQIGQRKKHLRQFKTTVLNEGLYYPYLGEKITSRGFKQDVFKIVFLLIHPKSKSEACRVHF